MKLIKILVVSLFVLLSFNNFALAESVLKQILINIAILNDFRMFSFSLIRTLQILETKWRETESDH